jgi:hypothetical protein
METIDVINSLKAIGLGTIIAYAFAYVLLTLPYIKEVRKNDKNNG